jgi:hypothetical protein
MIELFCKITFILLSAIILWQDIKDREVYWFLYPLLAFFSFLIQLQFSGIYLSLLNIIINIFFVSLLLIIAWGYYRFLRKALFVNNVIGSGDILMFYCLAPTLPSISFVTMFVFSLIFSLVLHKVIKSGPEYTTIPLAGYMALYFSVLYLVTFFCDYRELFPI